VSREALLANPDAPLPTAVAALHGLVRQLVGEVRRLRAANEQLRRDNEQVRPRLDQSLRLHFGGAGGVPRLARWATGASLAEVAARGSGGLRAGELVGADAVRGAGVSGN
jgi:hypothetical protein